MKVLAFSIITVTLGGSARSWKMSATKMCRKLAKIAQPKMGGDHAGPLFKKYNQLYSL
jgi:hypothetical protein